MRIVVEGPSGGLLDEIVDQLENRDHRVVIEEDDQEPSARRSNPAEHDGRNGRAAVDVVVDIAEPVEAADGWAEDRASVVADLIERWQPRRYVLISSNLVYAPVPDEARWPIREHFSRRAHGDPASRAFGDACIDAEDELVDQMTGSDGEYVILRPTMVVGSQPDGFADQLLEELSERPRIAGRRYTPAGTMQWVDVADLAAAVVAAVEVPAAADEAFTIAGADAFTSEDLARMITGEEASLDDISPLKFDTTKAETLLGWRPSRRLSILEGGAALRHSAADGSDEDSADDADDESFDASDELSAEAGRPFLAGQVAIVTGAGGDIGAAVAAALAGAGASVVLAARSERDLDRVADEVDEGADGDAWGCVTDVRDADSVEDLVEQVLDRYGSIDLLINVPDSFEPIGRPLWEVSDAQWRSAVAANLDGPFHTMRAVLGSMMSTGRGRIINVTSGDGTVALANAAADSATQAALDQLTLAVAAELVGTGVTVNSLDPGLTQPDSTADKINGPYAAPPGWPADWQQTSPEDAALLVLWLCSPDTAMLTGTHIEGDDPRVVARVERFQLWLRPWDREPAPLLTGFW